MIGNLGGQIDRKGTLRNVVENLCGKLLKKVVWKFVLKKWEEEVYSEKCTMYSKVVLLRLLRAPQCSSVWEEELFARLLLYLTHPAVVRDLKME